MREKMLVSKVSERRFVLALVTIGLLPFLLSSQATVVVGQQQFWNDKQESNNVFTSQDKFNFDKCSIYDPRCDTDNISLHRVYTTDIVKTDGYGGVLSMMMKSRDNPDDFKRAVDLIGSRMVIIDQLFNPNTAKQKSRGLFDGDCETSATNFFVFNSDKPTKEYGPFERQNADGENLKQLNITAETDIYVLIWGFQARRKDWVDHSKNLIATQARAAGEKATIIIVDWCWLSHNINVFRAYNEYKQVGNDVAKFMRALKAAFPSIDNSKLHCIGHSFGAQICGIASKEINVMQSILGLDPVGIRFDDYKQRDRLSKDDAKVVTVIHTDNTKIGSNKLLGHNDILVNGGYPQPGCSLISLYCSHNVAFSMFKRSSGTCNFVAFKCKTYYDMENGRCGYCAKQSDKCISIQLEQKSTGTRPLPSSPPSTTPSPNGEQTPSPVPTTQEPTPEPTPIPTSTPDSSTTQMPGQSSSTPSPVTTITSTDTPTEIPSNSSSSSTIEPNLPWPATPPPEDYSDDIRSRKQRSDVNKPKHKKFNNSQSKKQLIEPKPGKGQISLPSSSLEKNDDEFGNGKSLYGGGNEQKKRRRSKRQTIYALLNGYKASESPVVRSETGFYEDDIFKDISFENPDVLEITPLQQVGVEAIEYQAPYESQVGGVIMSAPPAWMFDRQLQSYDAVPRAVVKWVKTLYNYHLKTVSKPSKPFRNLCAHLYQVILVTRGRNINGVDIYLQAAENPRQIASVAVNTPAIAKSDQFFVYKASGDIKVKARAGETIRTALLELDPRKYVNKRVKFTRIALGTGSPAACSVSGIYINYMSSASYEDRVKYSSFVKLNEKCKVVEGDINIRCDWNPKLCKGFLRVGPAAVSQELPTASTKLGGLKRKNQRFVQKSDSKGSNGAKGFRAALESEGDHGQHKAVVKKDEGKYEDENKNDRKARDKKDGSRLDEAVKEVQEIEQEKKAEENSESGDVESISKSNVNDVSEKKMNKNDDELDEAKEADNAGKAKYEEEKKKVNEEKKIENNVGKDERSSVKEDIEKKNDGINEADETKDKKKDK